VKMVPDASALPNWRKSSHSENSAGGCAEVSDGYPEGVPVRPDLRLCPTGRGLKVDEYRKGRARPDGVLAPRGHFAGVGEWADPDGVLMVVEVTSHDGDTGRRDRQDKPAAYAAAGIPVCLLVDRDTDTVVVQTNPHPERGCYQDVHRAPFGEEVTLADPVGITLDTETLKNYVG